jgi:hypothetical protein
VGHDNFEPQIATAYFSHDMLRERNSGDEEEDRERSVMSDSDTLVMKTFRGQHIADTVV